jgi:transcriptional regulator with XRE-family HTH domain
MLGAVSNLQIRAARALLGWSQTRLSEEAGVSLITIKRLEGAHEAFPARYATVMAVVDALERVGIDFLPQAGGYSHGVRLRQPLEGRVRSHRPPDRPPGDTP